MISFGASNISEKRKGYSYLVESLENLQKRHEIKRDKVILLTAGKLERKINVNFKHIHMGFLKNEKELASFYQLSDLYISPTIEDSGPTMVNQAIMCGTPVVAFDIGVAQDLVINKKTGYKAKIKNSFDLTDGIVSILQQDNANYQKMREACRKIGIEINGWSD